MSFSYVCELFSFTSQLFDCADSVIVFRKLLSQLVKIKTWITITTNDAY
jgi:hypothetical protein